MNTSPWFSPPGSVSAPAAAAIAALLLLVFTEACGSGASGGRAASDGGAADDGATGDGGAADDCGKTDAGMGLVTCLPTGICNRFTEPSPEPVFEADYNQCFFPDGTCLLRFSTGDSQACPSVPVENLCFFLGDAGSGRSPSDDGGPCDLPASAASCVACCQTTHASGAETFGAAVERCACFAGGACADVCDSNFCGGQTPGGPCIACLDDEMTRGGACVAPVGAACAGAGDCVSYQACLTACGTTK